MCYTFGAHQWASQIQPSDGKWPSIWHIPYKNAESPNYHKLLEIISSTKTSNLNVWKKERTKSLTEAVVLSSWCAIRMSYSTVWFRQLYTEQCRLQKQLIKRVGTSASHIQPGKAQWWRMTGAQAGSQIKFLLKSTIPENDVNNAAQIQHEFIINLIVRLSGF